MTLVFRPFPKFLVGIRGGPRGMVQGYVCRVGAEGRLVLEGPRGGAGWVEGGWGGGRQGVVGVR